MQETEKPKDRKKMIMAGLANEEIDRFESAFKKSGLRSEADFLRYLITQYDRQNEKG